MKRLIMLIFQGEVEGLPASWQAGLATIISGNTALILVFWKRKMIMDEDNRPKAKIYRLLAKVDELQAENKRMRNVIEWVLNDAPNLVVRDWRFNNANDVKKVYDKLNKALKGK